MTQLSSSAGTLDIGPGRPVVLINDQLRVMDQNPAVLAELKAGRMDSLLALARQGQQLGADMVDILVDHPDLDETTWLPAVAAAVHAALGCPISLDSRNPGALAAALAALQPYRALINSVNAEPAALEAILPLARRYGAALVGMPVGVTHGLPKTVAGRLEEAATIVAAAEQAGLSRDDVLMDAICLASAVEPGSMRVTLETLAALHRDLGVATTLGIGNAGHGMPDPMRIDLAYLVAAVPWGLDSAYVNPATPGLLETARAVDFLGARDPIGRRYIRQFRAKSPASRPLAETEASPAAS